MLNRSDVTIVTGHDGRRAYPDMAEVARKYALKWGYNCTVVEVEPGIHPYHMKTDILQPIFGTTPWTVWMDADSILVNPIDELFTNNYDVGIAVKEGKIYSKRHGSYLYSGLVVWRNTPSAKWFLDKWSEHKYRSDQRELHSIVEPYIPLDDRIFNCVGQIMRTEQFDWKVLDPHKYVHQEAIHKMERWSDDVSILHFKGALEKCWPEYKKKFLC